MRNYLRVVPLWGEHIPFASPEDSSLKEHFKDDCDGIERLTDVTVPTMTLYPASGRGPHPAVLVCPGGGYGILAWNHEGIDICGLLNAAGFTAFLLKYRCPGRRTAAHADAARAIRLIRANAEEYEIDPDRVGIIGFSAGAHLAASISAPAESVPYESLDGADHFSFRPDFTALIYPAYLANDDLQLAPEFKIDAQTPPSLLVQAEDDSIHVENALAWFLASKRAGVKSELHVYPEGGHGYGLLRSGNPISNWGAIASSWFRRQAGVK